MASGMHRILHLILEASVQGIQRAAGLDFGAHLTIWSVAAEDGDCDAVAGTSNVT